MSATPRTIQGTPLEQAKWAGARLVFYTYLIASLFSVVGGFITAPLMSWYFFGTWKFWKFLDIAWKMFLHGWMMALRILGGDYGGFMFDVPMVSRPHSSPVLSVVQLNPTWEHGTSCGPCARCCEKIKCPILDKQTGRCRGYDSFFWRYFNCGRFPSAQREIDYYGCPKWEMKPGVVPPTTARPPHRPITASEPAMRTE
ncbi:MAG TPA: hypothetical protein VF678_05300 [bacterium]